MKLLLTILTTKEKLELYSCRDPIQLYSVRESILKNRDNPQDILAELESTIYNLTTKSKTLPKRKK